MTDPWVELTDFKPSSFSLELLQTLENFGFTNAILHGGALRDMYLGRENEINDYDVHANLAGIPLDGKNNAEKTESFLRHIQNVFPQSEGLSSVSFDQCTQTGAHFLGVAFYLQGKLVSLDTDDRNDPFPVAALYADAPMNSIGMNAKGTVIAHPLFKEHLENHIYAPFEGVDAPTISRRFSHLAAKFPDLKSQPSIKRTVPPPAPIFGSPLPS